MVAANPEQEIFNREIVSLIVVQPLNMPLSIHLK